MQTQGHPEPAGSAKITPAYHLPADYVIHTVGPIVQGPLTEEHERLPERDALLAVFLFSEKRRSDIINMTYLCRVIFVKL